MQVKNSLGFHSVTIILRVREFFKCVTIILRAPIIILGAPIMILRVPIIILRAPTGIPPVVEDYVCLGRSVGRAFRDVLLIRIASQVLCFTKFHCVSISFTVCSLCFTVCSLCFDVRPRYFFMCLLKLHVWENS